MSEILDAKPWWQSRGVIGSIMGIAVSAAVAFGVQLPAGFGEEATGVVMGLVGAVASGLALYGRVKAAKTISTK
jgi:peptidoglycan/LPS O-acetylase OafA/YrhL